MSSQVEVKAAAESEIRLPPDTSLNYKRKYHTSALSLPILKPISPSPGSKIETDQSITFCVTVPSDSCMRVTPNPVWVLAIPWKKNVYADNNKKYDPTRAADQITELNKMEWCGMVGEQETLAPYAVDPFNVFGTFFRGVDVFVNGRNMKPFFMTGEETNAACWLTHAHMSDEERLTYFEEFGFLANEVLVEDIKTNPSTPEAKRAMQMLNTNSETTPQPRWFRMHSCNTLFLGPFKNPLLTKRRGDPPVREQPWMKPGTKLEYIFHKQPTGHQCLVQKMGDGDYFKEAASAPALKEVKFEFKEMYLMVEVADFKLAKKVPKSMAPDEFWPDTYHAQSQQLPLGSTYEKSIFNLVAGTEMVYVYFHLQHQVEFDKSKNKTQDYRSPFPTNIDQIDILLDEKRIMFDEGLFKMKNQNIVPTGSSMAALMSYKHKRNWVDKDHPDYFRRDNKRDYREGVIIIDLTELEPDKAQFGQHVPHTLSVVTRFSGNGSTKGLRVCCMESRETTMDWNKGVVGWPRGDVKA